MKTLAHKSQDKTRRYARRKHRTNLVSKKLSDKPRLVVKRSNMYIYAQVIGTDGTILAQANDRTLKSGTKSERAFQVGEAIAKASLGAKIDVVVFDRNGYFVPWKSETTRRRSKIRVTDMLRC